MDQPITIQTYHILAKAVQICVLHGIKYAVLSPGSRSAPIALSFLRNKNIECIVLPDERSAAYTALGIAKETQNPVAIVCTSGTAALNYAPAVAEAYFSQIPLLVLTADRPPEWIGQADNQSIYQDDIYKNCKKSFAFPADLGDADVQNYALRIFNEALNVSKSKSQGPVHINIPLREPLYLEKEYDFDLDKLPFSEDIEGIKSLPDSLVSAFNSYSKVMVAAGMYAPDRELKQVLSNLVKAGKIVLVSDVTSNFMGIAESITFSDCILNTLTKEDKTVLAPELLITFGGPFVSKALKEFFRTCLNLVHWHISAEAPAPDTFQKLNKTLLFTPLEFFQSLDLETNAEQIGYNSRWQKLQQGAKTTAVSLLESDAFTERKIVYEIFKKLSENINLHLGNSLPVRHVSTFPFFPTLAKVYANRGTSGIDGTVSTAAGQSLVNDELHLLICGDLSFMYDSNGLWNPYLKGNLKIVVLNNKGGGIFRKLPGPRMQKELETYFTSPHQDHFEHLCRQHHCNYFFMNEASDLHTVLDDFLQPQEKVAVLEVQFP